MKKLLKKIKRTKTELFIALLVITSLFSAFLLKQVLAQTTLSGGNIVDAKNLTQSQANYADPISGVAGERVRIRVRVVNNGTEAANNVLVRYDLTNPMAPSVVISADNAPVVSDSVTINPSGTSLAFVSGSGLKYGPGCASGCAVGDEVVTTGVNLGNVDMGELQSFQLSIEVDIVGSPGSTNQPVFRSGNIFDGGNRTDALVDWQDPIPADPGEVIEFRVFVANDGNAVADNTSVRVAFPVIASNSLVPTAYIAAGGADTVTDTATVNVSGSIPQLLVYLPGHARMFGPGCTSGCALPDGITVHGVSIGSVGIGEANSVQVLFKAYVSNQTTPVPTPTPTPTPTTIPTPTPSTSPTPTPSALASPTPSATPQVLPETGIDGTTLLGVSAILAVLGVYLLKRFRLI